MASDSSRVDPHTYPPSNIDVNGIDPNLKYWIDQLLRQANEEAEIRSNQQQAAFRAQWDAREHEHDTQLQQLGAQLLRNMNMTSSPPNADHIEVDAQIPKISQPTPLPIRKLRTQAKPTPPVPPISTRSTRSSTRNGTTPAPAPPVASLKAKPKRTNNRSKAAPSEPANVSAGMRSAPAPPTPAPTLPAPIQPSAVIDSPPAAKSAYSPNTVSLLKRPKPAAHIHRMMRADFPEETGGLQTSMNVHIRILWNLLDAKMVPQDPPHALLDAFTARFSTEEALHVASRSDNELVSKSLVSIAGTDIKSRSRIATHACQVEEHILEFMQSHIAKFGLLQWCPDLRQTAYSLYNSACRIIALDTFKQAAVSGAYTHIGPNLLHVKNLPLLICMFDHIVFHHHFMRYKREMKTPGSVKVAEENGPQYQNRKRLAAARTTFLQENGYPTRYMELTNAKATSDDEQDPTSRIYHIKCRPERSTKAERFIRLLDERRLESAALSGTRSRERKRIVPSTNQQLTDFPMLPLHMPLDYFDPSFFNRLQPKLRSTASSGKVALLPNVEKSFGEDPAEKLDDDEFTELYGGPVLALYNQVEMVESDEGEWLDDGDDDMDDILADSELDEGEDEEVNEHRQSLIAHMSIASI